MTDPIFSSICSLCFFVLFTLLTADFTGQGGGAGNGETVRKIYNYFNFHDCPLGVLGSFSTTSSSLAAAANFVCLGLCIGTAFSLLAAFGGTAFRASINGDLLVRKQGICVTTSIMLMSIVKFSLVLTGATRIGCYGPRNYVFDPLQYFYWLCTTPTMLIMFGRMGGQPDALLANSATLIALTMILGFISALTMATPSWQSISALFFAISCLTFFFVSQLSVQILHGAHDASFDNETRLLLNRFFPIGSLLWLSFPIIALAVRVGSLSPTTEAILWPIVEACAKIFMCVIWTAGDFTRHQFLARERINNIESKRALSDSCSASMRSLTRYLFHELRVPLNAIVLGVAECREEVNDLVNGKPSVQQQQQHLISDSLETVSNNAIAMSKLLDDFLSLEKIEEGRIELVVTLIHVEKFVQDTVNLFVSLATAKNLDVTIVILPSVPRVFHGDANKIRQVLCNYLSNAIKFTLPGGRILVRVTSQPALLHTPSKRRSHQQAPKGGGPDHYSTDALSVSSNEEEEEEEMKERSETAYTLRLRGTFGSSGTSGTQSETNHSNSKDVHLSNGDDAPFIRFSVIDNGPGISKIDSAKLFEPFVQIRAGATQKKGNGGTGLGLSICKRLVQLFHGIVGVHSREGIGSCFYFVMPTGVGEGVDSSSVQTQNNQLEGGEKQLLSCIVVDDVESNRVLLGRMLTRRGVSSVLLTSDGAETLRMLDKPDVRAAVQCIFLDAQMPVMDGLECATRIRESGLEVCIIGITGNALESDRSLFLSAGASSVLTKPINVDVLEKALKSLGFRLAPRRVPASSTA